jgi:hypothetical protein
MLTVLAMASDLSVDEVHDREVHNIKVDRAQLLLLLLFSRLMFSK